MSRGKPFRSAAVSRANAGARERDAGAARARAGAAARGLLAASGTKLLYAALAASALALSGCALINLLPFPITTMPATADQVLSSAPNVWVQFSAAVDEGEVQPLFSVTGTGGQAVPGDLSWQGNKLTFTPASPFERGVRYVLTLQGTVNVNDGRTFQENIIVPFYVGTNAGPPIIASITPASGSTVGQGASVSLAFSQPMSETSFQDGFSLSPSTAYSLSWNASATTVTIAPKAQWTAETLYSWTLSTSCTAKSGVPLDRQWSGTYLVQQGNAPTVISVQPATVTLTGSTTTVTLLPDTGAPDVSGGAATPAPSYNNSLALVFSEDVNLPALESALSLSPAVAGTMQRVCSGLTACAAIPGAPAQAGGIFVYTPSSDWTMSQQYVLTISTALTDLNGNPIASPYWLAFTPSIPVQSVSEIDVTGTITNNGGAGLAETSSAGALDNTTAYPLDWFTLANTPATGLSLTITIDFSVAYADASHEAAMANAVSFAAYYPSGLSNPQVVQVNWTTPQKLVITYTILTPSPTGVSGSPPPQTNYYMLTIPAGASQSGTGAGSFLTNPVTVLLQSGTQS